MHFFFKSERNLTYQIYLTLKSPWSHPNFADSSSTPYFWDERKWFLYTLLLRWAQMIFLHPTFGMSPMESQVLWDLEGHSTSPNLGIIIFLKMCWKWRHNRSCRTTRSTILLEVEAIHPFLRDNPFLNSNISLYRSAFTVTALPDESS